MKQFILLRILLFMIAVLILPLNIEAKKSSKRISKKNKKEVVIKGADGYAFLLNGSAASMILEYTDNSGDKIRDEYIYQNNSQKPSMRLMSTTRGKWHQVDTVTYNNEGRVVRVGRLKKPKNKERVQIFKENGFSYVAGPFPPFVRRNHRSDEIRLTNFDSHDNWTTAFFVGDKKPLIKRKITYTYSPEQINLLKKNASLLEEVEQNMQSEELFMALFAGGIMLFCGIFCLIAIFMKKAGGGKVRWILLLIFGMPFASIAYFLGAKFLLPLFGSLRPLYFLITILVYMVAMWVSITTMSKNRRISNRFIEVIIIIWSFWALFVLCPWFMSSICPNIAGKILSYVLGMVLAMVNYNYISNRCPCCRNPHGLSFDHSKVIGTKTQTNRQHREKWDNHKVIYETDSVLEIGSRITNKDYENSTTHEVCQDYYTCVECGYVVKGGKWLGRMIDKSSSVTTSYGKGRTRFLK